MQKSRNLHTFARLIPIIMRNIYRQSQKLIGRACVAILALLGFSCSDEGNYCMYGTPTSDFEIKGSITSEDGNALSDVVMSVESKYNTYTLDADTTADDGRFELKGRFTGSPRDQLRVFARPLDSTIASDSATVTLTQTGKGDGAWYEGKGEQTVDFKLKKNKAE